MYDIFVDNEKVKEGFTLRDALEFKDTWITVHPDDNVVIELRGKMPFIDPT